MQASDSALFTDSLTTASDAPALDRAYKLQNSAGTPRRKRSEGESLLRPVMRNGRRLAGSPDLAAIRAHAQEQLARLRRPLAALELARYPLEIVAGLRDLAARLDRASAIDRGA